MMLSAKNINFHYPESHSLLLRNCNFHIDENSRIGLTGVNGSGKSTLIKLIKGELNPVSGNLSFHKKLTFSHLRQMEESHAHGLAALIPEHMRPVYTEMRSLEKRDALSHDESLYYSELIHQWSELGGYELESKIESAINRYEMKKDILNRNTESFSGGELRKVQILSSLEKTADLYLFDEPGNHLDIYELKWLSETLKSMDKPYILISHQRTLLDECCTEIWNLDNGQLNCMNGNYSTFLTEEENRLQHRSDTRAEIKTKIIQLSSVAVERRQKSEKMDNFKSSRSVAKNGRICKRDDGDTNCRTGLTKRMAKSAGVLTQKIQKLEQEAEDLKDFQREKPKIQIYSTGCKVSSICWAQGCTVCAGELQIKIPDFNLKKGEKLWLTGRNGSGKTTLLRSLITGKGSVSGILHLSSGVTTKYYEQNETNYKGSPMEYLYSICQKTEEICRTLGALKLSKELWNHPCGQLSSGERARIKLAECLLNPVDLLLLDEPCNHLELSARQALEEGLKKFEGSVILVSHDQYFAKNITDQVIEL